MVGKERERERKREREREREREKEREVKRNLHKSNSSMRHVTHVSGKFTKNGSLVVE